jgi:hypothetical protein
MRLKLKYIVIIGLVVAAAADTWWKASHRNRRGADDDATAVNYDLKARARELSQPSATIPTIAVTNWSVQLGAVLASGVSSTNQAISLLAMFPNLPAEGQVEAVQHATRLLPGEYFGALGAQLTNAAVAPAVRRAIFADLLARPNALKLPWLVELARVPMEGQSEEALFLLKSQLREDHGTNWPLWRERAAAWLSLHPD